MLQEHMQGTLPSTVFPCTRPQEGEDIMGQSNVSQSSLRSAKPTWARTRPSAVEPRQRVIVFMAGGATYSEARSCYEISQAHNKDVYLVTSHMLTPGLFLRQLGDLSVDKRRLDLPADRPKPQAPAHLFEREPPPQPKPQPPKAPAPPTAGLASMNINPHNNPRQPSPVNGSAPHPQAQQPAAQSDHKLHKKDKDKKDKKDKKEKKDKDKKKHRFFK